MMRTEIQRPEVVTMPDVRRMCVKPTMTEHRSLEDVVQAERKLRRLKSARRKMPLMVVL